MALSGSFQTTKDSHNAGSEWPCYIYVEWSAAQSVDNNTSTISWAAYGGSDGTSTTKYTETGPVTVTINGTTVLSLTSRFNMTKGQKIGSGTITIAHNTDGTKSISVGISAAIWQTAVNCTFSGTITLNTIPRATTPTVSSSSVAMNSAVTISTPRASSSFTHTLTYSFGSASGTIATGVGTSYSWTVPLSLANQVPNNTSGSCTITCKTYSGNTLIGTKTVTITLTVPSSVVPSISSVSTSDPTGYLSTYGAYVQGKSTLKVSVSASGSYSSTIKSYKIVANGSTYTAKKVMAMDGVRFMDLGNHYTVSEDKAVANSVVKAGISRQVASSTVTGLTDIYAVKFDVNDGFHAASLTGNSAITQYVPDFNTPGAVKDGEVEMVAATVLKNTANAGVLRNIKIA